MSSTRVERSAPLVQQVHAELKRRVLDGSLAPGQELRDSVIAERMGVSRVPVRDACNLLVQSGLLTKGEHQPFRVRAFSEAELGELQMIRWGYESVAARHLVRSRIEPIGVLEPLHRMAKAASDLDAARSGQADIDFHRALVASAGLEELSRRYESLMEQVALSMREIPSVVLPTQEYRHREILDVLSEAQQAGDPAPILRLLSTHLLTTRADLETRDTLPRPR